jgi:putative aldouronate transport system permease protein
MSKKNDRLIKNNNFSDILKKDFRKNFSLYMLVIPVIAFYAIFAYAPMYGAIIAFKKFSPGLGIMGSKWVGFDNFIRFFKDIYFWRILKNTLLLSTYSIIFGFPAPIILALALNEIRWMWFKRTTQTITYMPYFVAMVVIAGMIKNFTNSTGLVNDIIVFFGGTRKTLLMYSENFRAIYILSDIWKNAGFSAIIYLAALSSIDVQLYDAAIIDGANKFKRMRHVTLPGISTTIIILLILRLGRIFTIGFEKVLLLYNPAIYETSDIISTYVYRVGLQQFDWSYSTAIGFFNSVMNLIVLVSANTISRKYSGKSLW